MTDQELDLHTQIQNKLHEQITSLAHKHATVSFTLIGVLVLVLSLVGAGGYVALKMLDSRIARADKSDQAYETLRKDTDMQLKTGTTDRAKSKARQIVLDAEREAGDARARQDVSKALDPNAGAVEIQTGLSKAYINDERFKRPLPFINEAYQATGPQVQAFTATKIERDRFSVDVDSLHSSLYLSHDRENSCQQDLTKLQGTAAACEKVKNEWKGVAKASKFKRFLGGAEKVGLFMAGVAAAHYMKF